MKSLLTLIEMDNGIKVRSLLIIIEMVYGLKIIHQHFQIIKILLVLIILVETFLHD